MSPRAGLRIERAPRFPTGSATTLKRVVAAFAWLLAATSATASLDMPLRAPSVGRGVQGSPAPAPPASAPRSQEPPPPKMEERKIEIAPWERVPT